jgi:HD superfamily phosphohydrolase YqeK
MNNQITTLERLGFIADIIQVINYQLNMNQTSNDDLLQALNEQNKKYLKTIIEQNKEILERLNNGKTRNN